MKTLTKTAGKLLIATALLAGVAGCKKNIFDKQDLSAVDGTVVWSTASAANEFLNGTYDEVMPNWWQMESTLGGLPFNTSDELNNATANILYGTLTGTGNEVTEIYTKTALGTDQYFNIYRCNLGIQNLNSGSIDAADKASLKGQFFFLRAFTYFQMVKLYGGVPLITATQNPQTDNVQTPRATSKACFAQIEADCDSAAAMLPATWNLSTDGGRITRAAALAFKGKAALYWASEQFNPGSSTGGGDQSRWQAAYAANKAAYTQAVADGYALYPTFANIWIDETANNKERMIWRTLDAVSINPGHGTTTESITRPYSESNSGGGSNQPTWNLVKAFPCINGLPITDPVNTTPDATGKTIYNPTQFWLNRDPRFKATIAYNGCIWDLSGSSNRRQWTYSGFLDDAKNPSATGFYCRKICNPGISIAGSVYNSNSGGGSGMDWIEMRFAEVILNYAESSFYATGSLAECETYIGMLRARAGISPANNYGLANVTKAQMPGILLTEREVEFAMENKRNDDLRRTRTFDKLTGTQRRVYRWTLNSPYLAGPLPTPPALPVAGKIYIDVPDATGHRIADTINVDNPATYAKFFTGDTTLVLDPATTPVINYPVNYYFYPLPANFISSGTAILQTTGWPGGSFDPLKQ